MTLSGTQPIPDKSLARKAQQVVALLQRFYGIPQWRPPLSLVDELVSTILSQNTSDTNRDRAFERLKARFSCWEAVRDAPQNDVIEAVRSAGLANQKGARIQAILRQITEERGALDLDFLKEFDPQEARGWLSRFKGIGPKTTAILLQFSLGIPAFPVDTHIYRVTGRIGLRLQKMSAEQAHPWLEQLFQPEQYGAAHLNLIRLGRELCHPRDSECTKCPLSGVCDDFLNRQRGKGNSG